MEISLNSEYGPFCSCLASIPFLISLLYLKLRCYEKGSQNWVDGGQIGAGGSHVLFF